MSESIELGPGVYCVTGGHEGLVPSSRVKVGSVTAALTEWAKILDIVPSTITRRMRRFECLLDVLDPPTGLGRPPGRAPTDAATGAFIDRHPDGGSVEQIARELGLTPERVYQILEEALEKLRGRIEE